MNQPIMNRKIKIIGYLPFYNYNIYACANILKFNHAMSV